MTEKKGEKKREKVVLWRDLEEISRVLSVYVLFGGNRWRNHIQTKWLTHSFRLLAGIDADPTVLWQLVIDVLDKLVHGNQTLVRKGWFGRAGPIQTKIIFTQSGLSADRTPQKVNSQGHTKCIIPSMLEKIYHFWSLSLNRSTKLTKCFLNLLHLEVYFNNSY